MEQFYLKNEKDVKVRELSDMESKVIPNSHNGALLKKLVLPVRKHGSNSCSNFSYPRSNPFFSFFFFYRNKKTLGECSRTFGLMRKLIGKAEFFLLDILI